MMTSSGAGTSNQLVVTNTDEFVHSRTRHILCDDNWARDTINLTEVRLAVLITDFREVFIRVW